MKDARILDEKNNENEHNTTNTDGRKEGGEKGEEVQDDEEEERCRTKFHRVLVLDKAGARSRAVFTSGDILGIPEVLAGGNWALTAVASGQTSVQPFGASALFQTLDQMPATHSDFLLHIAAMA